jgi:hypothetical protein
MDSPGNTLVIHDHPLQLDLRYFANGTSWLRRPRDDIRLYLSLHRRWATQPLLQAGMCRLWFGAWDAMNVLKATRR